MISSLELAISRRRKARRPPLLPMTLSIFLAEDDPVLRDQLIAVIDDVCEAQVVASAETQSAATEWLHDHPDCWELAVLDLYLKEGTGFGVIESLASSEEKDRVVVLTNSASPANRARCLQLGAHAVFDKTLELNAFLDHCRELNCKPH